MAFRVILPGELEWTTREHAPDEAPRPGAGRSSLAGFPPPRANFWRYEPGAKGRRHRDMLQEETFVALAGTLSMYLGDPPERHEIPAGGLVHVQAETPLQVVNEGDGELPLFVYGAPP